MSNRLVVRTVDLPDMTVASVPGFGEEPELQAAQVTTDFARSLGLVPVLPTIRPTASTPRTHRGQQELRVRVAVSRRSEHAARAAGSDQARTRPPTP